MKHKNTDKNSIKRQCETKGNPDSAGGKSSWNSPRVTGLVAVWLLLAMFVTAAISSVGSAKTDEETIESAAAQTGGLQPAKEYVYAGSRMLAVEDYGLSSSPPTPTPTATPAPAPVSNYNAASDFSPTSNPAGAWSYGYKSAPNSAFTLSANNGQPWTGGVSNWSPNAGGACCPTVTENTTGATQTYAGGAVVQPAELLNLHPGASGEQSVVRWTAPAAGTYQIAGRFEGIDAAVGTTTDVHILDNQTEILSNNVNGYGSQVPFNLTVLASAGEAIDFAVGFGSNQTYNNDSTGLAASITPVAATVLTPVAVTASSSYGNNVPANVADNNPVTFWSAGDLAPQWIELDLGEPSRISKLRLNVEQNPAGHTTHQIFFGATPDNLTLVGTLDGVTEAGQWLEIPLAHNGVRYVKINTTASPSRVAWREIQVFGANSSSTTQPPASGNSASFVKTDTTTKGDWIGNYGGEGYALYQDATNLPNWAQMTLGGQQETSYYTDHSLEQRALQRAAGNGERFAAVWQTPSVSTFAFNFTDGQPHRLAIYCVDWDGNNGRTEKLEIIDGASGAVLDTKTLAAFSGGVYLVWQVTGQVTVRLTNTNAYNAQISAFFIDAAPAASSATPPPPANNSAPNGWFDGIDSNLVARGWSFDPDNSSASDTVRFYIDGAVGVGALIGEATANEPRPDVNQAYGITGDHGFAFQIPSRYADGRQHYVHAYAAIRRPAS